MTGIRRQGHAVVWNVGSRISSEPGALTEVFMSRALKTAMVFDKEIFVMA